MADPAFRLLLIGVKHITVLLVGDPFATVGQNPVCGMARGFAQQSRALSNV